MKIVHNRLSLVLILLTCFFLLYKNMSQRLTSVMTVSGPQGFLMLANRSQRNLVLIYLLTGFSESWSVSLK